MFCASRARYAGVPGAGPVEAPAMPGTTTASAIPAVTAARRARGRRMLAPCGGGGCPVPTRNGPRGYPVVTTGPSFTSTPPRVDHRLCARDTAGHAAGSSTETMINSDCPARGEQTQPTSPVRNPDDWYMGYRAAQDRYDSMTYRRTGRSGLDLPAISLGLWHNFGDDVPFDRQRAILRRAFDLGITHFDLANNYGPPYGSAETNFGRHLREDFAPYRDELVLSTKAGWDMWPGPYGQGGGSRKYVLASLDQSLRRLGLDYVDIFYSHRPDPTTPLEETMGALHTAVQSGKALYAGISSYSPEMTAEAARILR